MPHHAVHTRGAGVGTACYARPRTPPQTSDKAISLGTRTRKKRHSKIHKLSLVLWVGPFLREAAGCSKLSKGWSSCAGDLEVLHSSRQTARFCPRTHSMVASAERKRSLNKSVDELMPLTVEEASRRRSNPQDEMQRILAYNAQVLNILDCHSTCAE